MSAVRSWKTRSRSSASFHHVGERKRPGGNGLRVPIAIVVGRSRHLDRDLPASVRGADDDDRSDGEVTCPAVATARELEHARIETRGEVGDVRDLMVPDRDDDRARADDVAADGGLEELARAPERAHALPEARRQTRLAGVPLLIVGDLVLARERILAARKWQAGERVDVARREEPQRVPACAPCVTHTIVRIEEEDVAPGAPKTVRHREPAMAGAHDEDVSVDVTPRERRASRGAGPRRGPRQCVRPVRGRAGSRERWR